MKSSAMILLLFCLVIGSAATIRVIGSGAKIPADSQSDLARLIESLKSTNAEERASAACKLGEMAESAAPAIPNLINLLSDETSVGAYDCGRKRNSVQSDEDTVGRIAGVALARIGPLAVDPLALVLKTQDVAARKNAAFALGLLKDDRTVELLIAAITDSAGPVRARHLLGQPDLARLL